MAVSVALAEAPGVIGDLLERLIKGDSHFTVIGRYEHLDHVDQADAVDIVVMCTPDGSIPPVAPRLIEDRICRSFVAVSTRGKDVHVRCDDGREFQLAQASPLELLRAMHRAIASTGGAPIA